MDNNINEILENYFKLATQNNQVIKNKKIIESLEYIYSDEVVEKQKAINNVIITSIVYKILNPEQDIRNHRTTLEGGYSARGFDTKYIVPFLQSKELITMKESGWLTRSIEQDHPFNFNFPGKIRDSLAKEHFLNIVDYIQKANKPDLENMLIFIFNFLIDFKSKNDNLVTKLEITNIHTSELMKIFRGHYEQSSGKGVSRLPVLALYATLMEYYSERKNNSKILDTLDSHTSSDVRSGGVGDIHIKNNKGQIIEAIEVKSNIQIDIVILKNKYSLFKDKPLRKYLFCTTKDMEISDDVKNEILKIHDEHGCDISIFNLYQYVSYQLSNIENIDAVLENYLLLVKNDDAVQLNQKKLLQDLVK